MFIRINEKLSYNFRDPCNHINEQKKIYPIFEKKDPIRTPVLVSRSSQI